MTIASIYLFSLPTPQCATVHAIKSRVAGKLVTGIATFDEEPIYSFFVDGAVKGTIAAADMCAQSPLKSDLKYKLSCRRFVSAASNC